MAEISTDIIENESRKDFSPAVDSKWLLPQLVQCIQIREMLENHNNNNNKWIHQAKFEFGMRLFTFHFMLMPFGKA